jgi:hypothetical protein
MRNRESALVSVGVAAVSEPAALWAVNPAIAREPDVIGKLAGVGIAAEIGSNILLDFWNGDEIEVFD